MYPNEANFSDFEAARWRKALKRIMSPEMVMSFQMPIMGPDFVSRIHKVAQRGEEVPWRVESRSMAFSVAARAALGDLLTQKDIDTLFPWFEALSKGTFSLVRSTSKTQVASQ
jgi:hypothetical protein